MTQDEIIKMAWDSGAYTHRLTMWGFSLENLERFVNLATADAVAKEREACAKIEVLKQALKQALEALNLCTNAGMIPMYLKANQAAITSLRQAIAELESQDHIEQHLEMVKQKHKNNIWEKQLSAAQRNELLQIKDGTWEADRNG